MNETTINPVVVENAPYDVGGASVPKITELSGFGDLVSKAYGLLQKNINTVLIAAAIPATLQFLVFIVTSEGAVSAQLGLINSIIAMVVLIVAGIVFSIMMSIVIAHAIDATTKGTPITTGQAFNLSWSRVPGYILVAIIAGLAGFGGSVLLIIPGIILGIWFMFNTFAFLFDNARGFSSLQVSRNYVRGHAWQLFVRLFLLIAIAIVAMVCVSFITTALGGNENSLIFNLIAVILQSAIGVFFVAFTYSMYAELKTIKIGAGEDVHAKNDSVIVYGAPILGIVAFIIIAAGIFITGSFLLGNFKASDQVTDQARMELMKALEAQNVMVDYEDEYTNADSVSNTFPELE